MSTLSFDDTFNIPLEDHVFDHGMDLCQPGYSPTIFTPDSTAGPDTHPADTVDVEMHIKEQYGDERWPVGSEELRNTFALQYGVSYESSVDGFHDLASQLEPTVSAFHTDDPYYQPDMQTSHHEDENNGTAMTDQYGSRAGPVGGIVNGFDTSMDATVGGMHQIMHNGFNNSVGNGSQPAPHMPCAFVSQQQVPMQVPIWSQQMLQGHHFQSAAAPMLVVQNQPIIYYVPPEQTPVAAWQAAPQTWTAMNQQQVMVLPPLRRLAQQQLQQQQGSHASIVPGIQPALHVRSMQDHLPELTHGTAHTPVQQVNTVPTTVYALNEAAATQMLQSESHNASSTSSISPTSVTSETRQPGPKSASRSPTAKSGAMPQVRSQQLSPGAPRAAAARIMAIRKRQPSIDARPLQPRHGPQGLTADVEPKRKRGGRKHGMKLETPSALNASKMRKLGDCWRCVLQRDKCDDGEDCGDTGDCSRCVRALLREDSFGCHRMKLFNLIGLFLPSWMTSIHQRDSVEDALANDINSWKPSNRFEITMTIGWGKPLLWKVCEFTPKNPGALIQYQYFQDPKTRQMTRFEKFSPPLAIEKLESEHRHFEDYLESLYDEEQLHDFSEMCYASESRHETFQEELLDLICKLYLAQGDRDERPAKGKRKPSLKTLLKKILRMLILTYIMGHTMTIVEDTLPDVLRRVPSQPPSCSKEALPWAKGYKHISPRLTNRQLKFHFCGLRQAIYADLLKDMQIMMASSTPKDETWLPVFCTMLGFAMVLEEVQCSLQIQADALTRDKPGDVEEAQNKARRASESIDENFGLMIQLFQRKYRDRGWVTPGPLANQTPQVQYNAEQNFLQQLRTLVEKRRQYLEYRSKVKLGHEYQCFYTSRLVSKFLLPFLSLPV